MKILVHLLGAVFLFLILGALIVTGSPAKRTRVVMEDVKRLSGEVRKGQSLAHKVPQLEREIRDLSLKLESLQEIMKGEGFGDLFQANPNHRCFRGNHHVMRRMGLLEEEPAVEQAPELP